MDSRPGCGESHDDALTQVIANADAAAGQAPERRGCGLAGIGVRAARATIWRLSPAGELLSSWQAQPDHLLAWNRAARLEPTENGDAVLLASEICAHTLLRIDLSSGAIVWDSGELTGNPVGFDRDAGGRSMVSASLAGCGPAGPTRIAEIDARRVQCRTLHRKDLQEIALASGPQGWLLGGVTPFNASLGSDAMVESWNAGAACVADSIFVDGFEERIRSRSPYCHRSGTRRRRADSGHCECRCCSTQRALWRNAAGSSTSTSRPSMRSSPRSCSRPNTRLTVSAARRR